MKKYFYFLFFLVLLTSCTEDIKFNNPAFQTLKNNVFWRAQTYKAYFGANGTVVIEGSLGYENVILQTASSAEQTFILGVNETSKASYENTLPAELSSFSTGTNIGNGQIVITEYDTDTNTISGTFKFTAINEDESDTENPKINFTEGVFYKVPIEAAGLFQDDVVEN
ncbi:hypothetical protein DBB36_09590 [Flavobacterium sp. WLB]|uniref:DUF6252 family protein n=1 Tax=unclassified Flavobacterium TaxID=196869 RepID=UPI0006AB8BF5|nr:MULTISPECIES: DUF6252 family protein [unclassified Flavobacterium]KOP38664.1 hypothetical protein AKO67_08350 [Flavobacterium sp. VMW]OWU90775.1 hypothetical protein APR43_09840 [Flavobacterium sp. NLM]PUU70256.1 hypothetical protein DBB36_09590 [Flavobacterium sp. WLB]